MCTLKLLWDVEKAGNKQNTLYFVSLAMVYMATLALDYPIATGVLNPAVGAAIVVQAEIWQQFSDATYGKNNQSVSLIKCFVPYGGGLCAGLLFIWMRKLLEHKILYPSQRVDYNS